MQSVVTKYAVIIIFKPNQTIELLLFHLSGIMTHFHSSANKKERCDSTTHDNGEHGFKLNLKYKEYI